jgi:hypothetical protein
MAVTGRLEDIGIDEVLQLLGVRNRSGVLTLVRRDATARVVLRQGRVVFASSDAVSRFGHSLVEQGIITKDDLRSALVRQKQASSPQPLASVLLDLALVSKDVLEAAVRAHILKVFSNLLSWADGVFHFEVQIIEDRPPVQFLLLEGARSKDESSQGINVQFV